MRALVFLDRLDEALAIPAVSGNQEFWHFLAAALAGREEDILAGKPFNSDQLQAYVSFWRAIRARARGDLTAAHQLLENINLGDSLYSNRQLGFARCVIEDFLPFIDGDRKPFAARLDDIAAHRKGVFEQRLWYYGKYIAGHLTDEQFMAQPVVLHRTGSLAICRAMRAEWEGRTAEAAAAYRAYLALPPHLRLILMDDRDPLVEAFAAWRAEALAHQR